MPRIAPWSLVGEQGTSKAIALTRPVAILVDNEDFAVRRLGNLLSRAGVQVIVTEDFRSDVEGTDLQGRTDWIDLVQVDLLLEGRQLRFNDVVGISDLMPDVRVGIVSQLIRTFGDDNELVAALKSKYDYVLDKSFGATAAPFLQLHFALRSLRLRQLTRIEQGLDSDPESVQISINRLDSGIVSHDSSLPVDIRERYEHLIGKANGPVGRFGEGTREQVSTLVEYEALSKELLMQLHPGGSSESRISRRAQGQAGSIAATVDWTVPVDSRLYLYVDYEPPPRMASRDLRVVVSPTGLTAAGSLIRKGDASKPYWWKFRLEPQALGVRDIQVDLFIGNAWQASTRLATFVYSS